MSPTTSVTTSQLRQIIYYHLDNDMLDNANFLASRLHALEPRNPDSVHLLALTYYRLRRFRATYDFAHKYGANGRHLGCAYVFAQACLEMGRNLEGVTALEKARTHWVGKNDWNKHSETSRRHVPDAPAASVLLAKLYRAHGDLRRAGDCYIDAHKGNPLVWDAFEGLCKIGADLKMEKMFTLSAEMRQAPGPASLAPQIHVDEYSKQPLERNPNYGPHPSLDDPFTSGRTDSEDQDILSKMKGKPVLKSAASEWDTPNTNGGGLDDDVTMLENHDDVFNDPPAAPSRRLRPGNQFETSDRPRPPMLRGTSEVPDDPFRAPRKPSAGGQKRTISGAVSQTSADSAQPRRSNRIFTQSSTTRTTRSNADTTASTASKTDRAARAAKAATGTKGRTGAVVGRVVSGNRKIMPPDEREKEDKRAASRTSERSTTNPPVISSIALPPTALSEAPQADSISQQEAFSVLLDDFKQLAMGYNALSSFKLAEAIQIFKFLPSAQRETPWVLAQLGKAQYEAADYRAAEESFARLMKMQPSRTEDMEIYSTILWHLKKEANLSFLCRVLRDNHFDAPQTWIAVGNAFSLTREHDQAISAFKRAAQLDEKFAYAWTLMGHEYIANEAFDAALASFRRAVSIDRRGYVGWYGMGKCYQQMGKLEDAEHHYRIAATINPSNSTLLVCVGVVLEHMRNKHAALVHYSKALDIAPQSALARFKKARVLMHLKDYREALAELRILHQQAPDEANVHFLLGKCYKGLGNRAGALKAFTTALNLDVKATPFIKEAMDALADEDNRRARGERIGDDDDDDEDDDEP